MPNVQIYPNKNFCYPNDIFSKRLFELSDDDYHKALKERTKTTDRKVKLRVRKLITAIFEHLTSLNIIKAYHTNKKGIEYYSISFTVAPNAKAKTHKSVL